MADIARLEQALRNADAAGDVDAAKVFAAEIRKMQGAQSEQSTQMQQANAELSALTQKADPTTGDRMAFEALPTWQKPLQAADDVMRKLANGMTFGYADKLAGMASGDGTEAERMKTLGAENRAGGAGTAAEIVGNVATGMGLAGKGMTLAGLGGTGTMTGATGLAARTGLMGVEGAGYGALNAAGNDQDLGQGALIGAAGGGAGNLLGEAASGAISKIAGMFNKRPQVMTPDQVGPAAAAAYKAADDAGGVFTAPEFSQKVGEIKAMLAEDAYLPGNQPGVRTALKELNRLDGQNITFKGLEAVRRKVRGGYDPLNKDNNRMLYKVIDKIDDFATKNGSDMYPEARDLYSRKAKIESLNHAFSKGEKRAAITGSGGNTDNVIRQNVDKVATKMRGATPDEMAALENAAYGTPMRNALRTVGRMSPTNGSIPLMFHTAMNTGGLFSGGLSTLASLGITGASAGAKVISERGTKNAVKEAIELIAAGGKKSAMEAPKNAVQRLAESKREAIGRALMLALPALSAQRQ